MSCLPLCLDVFRDILGAALVEWGLGVKFMNGPQKIY